MYEKPEIKDYGSLVELTAAVDTTGQVDGASFDQPNHHTIEPTAAQQTTNCQPPTANCQRPFQGIATLGSDTMAAA